MLHDKVEKETIHMGLFQGPDAEYLTDYILASSDSLWNEAEAAVKDLPEVLRRVKIGRLSVDYAIIWRDSKHGQAWIVDQENLRLKVNPSFTDRIKRFCSVAKNAGVIKLKEFNYTVNEFRADMEKKVTSQMLEFHEPLKTVPDLPGLLCQYYTGNWKKMPDFNTLKAKKRVKVERFKLPFKGDEEMHGFTFTGYISVPNDGIYTFWTRSDGYSSLRISSTKVVNNNGPDPVRIRCGFIALKAGVHPVSLTFYTKNGSDRLEVYYRGPGIEKQEIPPAVLGTKKAL